MRVACVNELPPADIQFSLKEFKPEFEVVKDAPEKEQMRHYDALIAFHQLQRHPQSKTLPTLNSWKQFLKPKGEISIFVPSLEWSARNILLGTSNPLTIPAIYGLNGENQTGFTMLVLRRFMELAKINVLTARSGAYTLGTSRGEFRTEQHYVRGVVT